MKLTIDDIKPYLLFECISGSRAYGLDTETSDTDIKGVFYLPRECFFGLEYVPQVNNETNDSVYYELGRFIELLCASNPSSLELINAPSKTILFKHPLMSEFKSEWFLSKKSVKTLVHYVQGQIKKAQGLNKKMVNPVEKEHKTLLDFCYIIEDGKSLSLYQWLTAKGWEQHHIGLVNIAHAQDLYGVYYGAEIDFKGVISQERATTITLSSVPKQAQLHAYLYVNHDGFSQYCKSYGEYWNWVECRNVARYKQNVAHGHGYDSKNMMHVFRLLYSALGVAKEGKLNVWCDNRQGLLAIKAGQYRYEQLLLRSSELIEQISTALISSELSDDVNKNNALKALVNVRNRLYQEK